MLRIVLLSTALVMAAAPASAQVEVTQLAAPDAFSTPGRDTGLAQDLWRGTPLETARAVLPMLSARPLSPAAAALARRVLATGAPGPQGAVGDPTLGGARAGALLALGDVAAATRILERAPGLERNAELSRAAAETSLLAGDTARACQLADGLSTGRGEAYWLRLRAFCQLEAGQADQAQLTFDLAQTQARDAVYGRLMLARMAGGAPGAASARNGLDLALSRSLNLDLAAAKPAPAVAAALTGGDPPPPFFDTAAIDAQIGGLAQAVVEGLPSEPAVSALIAAAAEAEPKSRAKLQSAALLVAALANDLPMEDRARISGFTLAEGKGPAGRSLALEAAADGKRVGEAALLALWTAAEAGAAGPAVADRVRIVRVLSRIGLANEARLFVLEGLAGLK